MDENPVAQAEALVVSGAVLLYLFDRLVDLWRHLRGGR